MRHLKTALKWLAPLALALIIGTLSIQPLLAAPPDNAPRLALASAPATISEEEAAALTFMVEEEKMARDLYLAFSEQSSLRVFTNIAKAEQKHMDAVGNLLDIYGLEDPTLGAPAGVFQNEEIQATYDQLLAEGSASLTAALQAGVTVEEVDIADLEERIAQTDNPAIVQVFTHLQTGSTHHLQAYTRTLARTSGTN